MHSHKKLSTSQQLALALGALGVVYGDIGTSPLYAIKEIFFAHSHLDFSPANILGVVSLVFWSLTLIVAFKYVVLVLRADNDGEGGVFALFSLLKKIKLPGIGLLSVCLILAAGLLFGDGVITPAISVISAIEGLSVVTHTFDPYIVPITIAILSGLFFIQRFGTDKIGKLFGPIIALWFVSIGLIGLSHIVHNPEVFAALNPMFAVHFLTHTPVHVVLLILGSVMLVVTGGEAMYADMGHFGRLPIRISWFGLTYPALLMNYFGQGAFLLSGKEVIAENIFYSMVPSWALVPMIGLATCATIIASQALITGAFSLASQAVGLGLLPLLKTKFTHEEHEGQIYMPAVNWLLYIGCILLVIIFKSSTNLAAAYGLAVSGVMLATTISMIYIAIGNWKWSPAAALALFIPLAIVDATFLSANSLKIFQGGYVPLSIGIAILLIMKTWAWGRNHVAQAYARISDMDMKRLVTMKKEQKIFLPRSIIVMTPSLISKKTDKVPFLEQIFWERYGMLPKHLVFLTVVMQKQPYSNDNRYEVTHFYDDPEKGSISAVRVNFGFMEEPDLEDLLEEMTAHDEINIDEDPSTWLFHIAQERVFLAKSASWLKSVQFRFFHFLLKNATTYDTYFKLGRRVRLSIESIAVRFQ